MLARDSVAAFLNKIGACPESLQKLAPCRSSAVRFRQHRFSVLLLGLSISAQVAPGVSPSTVLSVALDDVDPVVEFMGPLTM